MSRTRSKRHLKVVSSNKEIRPHPILRALSGPVRVLLTSVAFGSGALIVTVQVFLRLIYGLIFILALALFIFSNIFAHLGHHPPANYWPNVWHGESVFGMMILAGILMDITLFAMMFFVGIFTSSVSEALPE
jgi:hypothetical protein